MGGSLRGLPLHFGKLFLWHLKQRPHSSLKVFSCFRPFFVFCFTLRHTEIMRSLFTLWLLTVLLHTSLTQAQTKKPQVSSGKTDNTQTDQNKTNNPSPSSTMQAQPNPIPCCQGTDSASTRQDNKTPDSRIVRFTGWLAVLAFLQFGAMAAQYCAMRKQGEFMRRGLLINIRSARAANTSAHASKISATASLRGMELAAKNYELTKESMETTKQAANAAAEQAATSKRQLEVYEAIQAARLVFEDFRAEIMGSKEFIADITITLTNHGPTVAHDLSLDKNLWVNFGTYNREANPNPPSPAPGTAAPKPYKAGPSLGPGKSLVFNIRWEKPTFDLPPALRFLKIPGVMGAIKLDDMVAPTDLRRGAFR